MAIELIPQAPPIRDIGGVLRIGQTGVLLETALSAFLQGSTPEDIVDQFPTLTLADVYEVIAYYLRHREEIERYLEKRSAEAQEAAGDLLGLIPETRLQARLRRRPQQ